MTRQELREYMESFCDKKIDIKSSEFFKLWHSFNKGEREGFKRGSKSGYKRGYEKGYEQGAFLKPIENGG